MAFALLRAAERVLAASYRLDGSIASRWLSSGSATGAVRCCPRRAYATEPTGGPDEMYVGAYTHITKKLWFERASKRAAAAMAEPTADGRAPRPIGVTYNFSTDRTLQEMVSCKWLTIMYRHP